MKCLFCFNTVQIWACHLGRTPCSEPALWCSRDCLLAPWTPGLRLGLASGGHWQETGGGEWVVFPLLSASWSLCSRASGRTGQWQFQLLRGDPALLSVFPAEEWQQLPAISNLWVASPPAAWLPSLSQNLGNQFPAFHSLTNSSWTERARI